MSIVDFLIYSVSFAVFIFLVYTVFNQRFNLFSNKKKNGFLILGLPDSGKTTIWAWFRYIILLPTQTSIKINDEEVEIQAMDRNRKAHLIDIPGNPKIRPQFSQYLPICTGILFVIDSSKISENYHSVAEFLYQILVSNLVFENEIPILFVCNKRDIEKSIDKSAIQDILEAELEELRNTQSNALDKHDDNGDFQNEVFLGLDGAKFKFSQLPNQITFMETSFTTSVDKLPVIVGTSDLLSWVMDQLDE
ncbi:Signal recognition particle receptor subunit beta [Smittium culicis]|uniref:Signal recognition particle receptor subunit beta n=1 Tax=Smittium culicis TaxID=133412 RepID=A0A1R1YR23_9FUNG|nr:Signal recognition particle receptor subunit beta [Smittium culicis]